MILLMGRVLPLAVNAQKTAEVNENWRQGYQILSQILHLEMILLHHCCYKYHCVLHSATLRKQLLDKLHHADTAWKFLLGRKRKEISKEVASDSRVEKKQARKTGKHLPKSLAEKSKQNCRNRNYKPVWEVRDGRTKHDRILTNLNGIVWKCVGNHVCAKNEEKTQGLQINLCNKCLGINRFTTMRKAM